MQEYRNDVTGKTSREHFSDLKRMDERAVEMIADGSTITKRVKIGRNDPCCCGSGKKFKRCCIVKLDKYGAPSRSGSLLTPIGISPFREGESRQTLEIL